ncbi:oligoendopeptidase F [Deinococcus sp. KSM4-11]|uniref:M3 family oligoendopeptidase n=1 Tax=Deinococcus sp. KSM4-11 TaxID=2568654 RepID=UPI0010A3DB5A|nr:M3 family oligoendopeptidase [Deinococcus sp. KSM4-11]THF88576.1 oligoendopeptidase F [Deinococcus sp. KSM4-11]
MTITDLPRWRTTDLYAGLDDPALASALSALADDVGTLGALYDELNIHEHGNVVTVPALERVLDATNRVTSRAATLRSYLNAFTSTDSRDAVAQQLMSRFTTTTLPLGPLRSRLTAWFGELDEVAIEALTAGTPELEAHAHLIRRAVALARHQMGPAEEDLAARLRPSGAGGWAKLHGNVSSVLTGTFREQTLPVTALRALATDPDEAVRKEAFDAEIAAWKTVDVVMAACLNGVKGEEGTLATRRGFTSPVGPSLLTHGIDAQTLDAMQGAVARSLPEFHRYFRAKAHALGKSSLDWWDLFAPVGHSATPWTYDAGTRFVERQFRAYSPALGDFAARAFREDWVDAGPRDGKRSGAFCMRWEGDQSRVLMNHDPSLDSVSTLAHELGHAYHNLQLAHLPPLQRETPMTLAETASIFCETIIQNAALEQATGEERLYALETQLLGHAQVVVDIHSRFLFEQAVYERRAERDLVPQELCDLMTWAQRETHGDALGTLHPYMWAVKGHYYGLPFYNYPYTFGLLFGLGLYAQYQTARTQGDEAVRDFQRRYDTLLSRTGQATPLDLAQGFGIDLRAPDFWEGSLDVIRRQIAAYVELTA